MKYTKLKSVCWVYQGRGNHIAKITGASADSNFEREYLARAENDWQFRQTVTVNEPGLYEVRNNKGNGSEDSYTVFDGKNKAPLSYQDALALAAHLKEADLKQIVSKALIPARQKRKAIRLRKKKLCLWMLDACQQMGALEHRHFSNNCVAIEVTLPIKLVPCKSPAYVGFGVPTLCGGRNSTKYANGGHPDFQALTSKTLNQLTQSELEVISKPMCKAYDETAMIQRALAVINHAQPEKLPPLQMAVDLTENFAPEICPYNITAEHYNRFLRLAANQGCQLHPKQITYLL